MNGSPMRRAAAILVVLPLLECCSAPSPQLAPGSDTGKPWFDGFWSCARHWYASGETEGVISPLPSRPRYASEDVAGIADNVLLYQKSNGGWPKNYDMQAILTEEQIATLVAVKEETNTTFDNGATHSQIHFLAHAYRHTEDERYRDGCLRGIEFILSAQYSSGGWPQFYPDPRGYQRYITFNDGVMIGVMTVLRRIEEGDQDFAFVSSDLRDRVRRAYEKGVECILRCQIVEDGRKTVWCQQHDEQTLSPREARTFEPAALASQESAEIVLFLMGLDAPGDSIISAVGAAVEWFRESAIEGIRVSGVPPPEMRHQYRSYGDDKVVTEDPEAPPIWARFYELGTGRPLFANRDGRRVHVLEDVDRERRIGYGWYSYDPQKVLKDYEAWRARRVPNEESPR